MSNEYQRFGKYILLEKLASGGMAEVFLALSQGAGGIGRFVAIKRILPQFSHNVEFIQMFKEEAKIAMNLSHSNIVPIFDFGMEDNQFYLVMDFIQGRNLRQILNKLKKKGASFSIEQIIYIVKDMASGLDHAHRCLDGSTGKPLNITHRDISPQNVMISYEGEVKIVDFGIAKAETQVDHTQAGTLKGKFGYMSPEQAEGYNVDLRTDVFSLGIVLWELLANERLFIANNEMNTLRKIRDCRIPSLEKINPSIHPELDRITQKALAKERNSRYQTAADLQKDLNRFLNRQYPDFSQQDLSHFFKSIYAEEILDIRRRLVKHSKKSTEVQFENEDTQKTETITTSEKTEVTETEPSISANFNNHAPKGLNEEVPHSKVSLTKTTNRKSSPTQTSSIPLKSYNPAFSVQTTQNRTSTRTTSKPYNYVKRKKNNFFNILAIIAVCFALFLILNAFKPKVIQSLFKSATQGQTMQSSNIDQPKILGQQNPSAVPNPKNHSKATPTMLKSNIIVNSSPSGAEIYVNSVNTNLRTPAMVNVPSSQNLNITLKKDKYINYTREINAKKKIPKSISATLQKANIGYIDIDVRPPKYVKLYVNNILLEKEKPPVLKYAIPANQKVSIRAINPIDNSKAVETILLKPEQRKKIILKLKK